MRENRARVYPSPDRFAARSSGHRARFSRAVALRLAMDAAPASQTPWLVARRLPWQPVPEWNVTVEKKAQPPCAPQAEERQREVALVVVLAVSLRRRRAGRAND